MVVAIAVIGMVTLVVLILVNVALRESRMTGSERQRGVAIASAEGQVDYLIAQIHSRAIGTLAPFCGTLAPLTATVASDELTITSGVEYFDATNALIPCTSLTTGAIEATTARVYSTSTSTPKGSTRPAVRNFETVIRLKLDTKLNKAIFGSSKVVTINNGTVIKGTAGASNADVYSKGDVVCNASVYGSIYSQGAVSLNGECNVDGQVVAKSKIDANINNGILAGDLSASNGSILFNQTRLTSVKGKARASGMVSGQHVCGAGSAKCLGGLVVDPPPDEPFPKVVWNAAEWAAAGYTNVVNINYCGNTWESGSVAYWLLHTAPTIVAPTAVVTDCRVVAANLNGTPLRLNNNVAIFASGGFEFNGSISFVSTDANVVRDLYLIQPWAPINCFAKGIHFDTQVTIASSVHALMYTPNNFYSNGGDVVMNGQIYSACEAEINNKLTLTYQPLPVWGITNKEAMSYRADILAKRETQG